MHVVTTYGLLGSVEVRRDGALVDVGGGKQVAVLALLLLEAGRVVSLDRIVDALWGDEPPPSAAPSVQVYVSKLRRALAGPSGTTPISRRPPGYLIEVEPDALDLDRFRRGCEEVRALVAAEEWAAAAEVAARTAALHRGPLVAQLADEEWVRVAARPWEERHLHLRQDQVTALLGCGRDAEAVTAAERLHSGHPLDERACWLHVLALHRVGRTAEALETWRAFARTLDEDLGLEPGASLRELQSALLRQDDVLDVWPREPGDVAGDAGAAAEERPETLVPTQPLVGRAHETAVLDRTWARVRAGASAWVLVSGPAGIGKSRVAEEGLRRWEAAGGRSVRVGCPDDVDLPAWWPLRRLLLDLAADPGTVLEPGPGPDLGPTRFVVAERLVQVLRTEAGRAPLVVHLDDVQWADPSTLRVLTHLAATDRTGRLALLLTCRDEEHPPEVERLLTAVARRQDAVRLLPGPLGEADVAALAASVSPAALAPDDVAELTRTTGGNPLFVGEYARLPVAERRAGTVPVVVRSVLQRRVSVLDPAVLDTVRAAAVVGEPLDLGVLRSVSGLDDVGLAAALDAAVATGLLVPGPGPSGLRFGHALIRRQLLDDLPLLRRQQLAAAAAAALDGRTGADQLARRAGHLLAAGPFADPGQVVAACRAAAEDAERRWSGEDAVRWWERALAAAGPAGTDEEERDRLVLGLASALARTGQGQRMLDLVDDALLEAWREGRTGSVGVVASLLLRLTGCWPWPAYGSDPGPLTARLAGLEPRLGDDHGARARVLAALAIGSCYDLDPQVPEGLSRRSLAAAEASGDPDVLADALLGRAMTFSGVAVHAREVLELRTRLERLPHRLERLDEVVGHGLASMATLSLGEVAATAHHVEAGTQLASSLRLPVNLAQLRWAESALTLWRTDDVDAVAETQARALRLHGRTELVQPVTLILARLALRWEQGLLAEGLGLAVDNPFLAPWIDAVVAAARREPTAGEQLAHELARPEPEVWTSHGRLTLLAHAAADLGLAALAPDLLERLQPYATFLASFGQTGVVGPVALASARLGLLTGDTAAAAHHLGVATALAGRTGGRNALLRCRLLREQLRASTDGAPDHDEVVRVAEAARARGLRGVAQDARRLLGEEPEPGRRGVPRRSSETSSVAGAVL